MLIDFETESVTCMGMYASRNARPDTATDLWSEVVRTRFGSDTCR